MVDEITNPLVSIVIVSHRPEKLISCLRTVNEQTYRPIEVIVETRGNNPAQKRNLGFKQSHGDFILFLEDDERPSSYLISECLDLVGDIIGVPIAETPPKTYFGRCIYMVRTNVPRLTFFSRSALEGLGDFNPNYIFCDDVEFEQRARFAGLQIDYIKESSIKHEPSYNLKYMVKQVYYASKGFRMLNMLYGPMGNRGKNEKKIIQAALSSPKYLPGIALVMILRAITRRLS